MAIDVVTNPSCARQELWPNWVMRRCGSNAQAVPVRIHTTKRADTAACDAGARLRWRSAGGSCDCERGGSFTCAQYPRPSVDVTPKPPAAHLQFSVGQLAVDPPPITIVMDYGDAYWNRDAAVNATRPGMTSVTAVPE